MMLINELLEKKNMSRYRLSKESGVAQTTIADICSGKARIEKCSADTLYLISKTLGVSMESLLGFEMEKHDRHHRTSFEVYKSNVCHFVKDKGDLDFIRDVLISDEIRDLYQRKWYVECFYLLAMTDYLSRLNEIPLCTKYDDIRQQKMDKVLYPADVVMMDTIMNTDENRKESVKKAIPEFLRHNIVEVEVRNVY